MTDQKLIDDVLAAFADREITAPSRDDIARVLEVFETSLRLCGCGSCTTARRERIGLTDHDLTSLARVLHEVVYSPGASFDRAVPGIQEHMLACADKVAAALPWIRPAHPPTDDERRVPGFAEREKRASAAWEFFTRTDSEMSHDFRGGYHQGVIDEAGRRSEVPELSDGWSDASVIAALTAYDPDGVNHASWTEGAISDMRAALAAASAAKKAQREHEAGQHISDLIERSSLGTPDAQALRATVSEEKARALVAEADRRSEPQVEPSGAPTVQLMARKGGKTQTLIEQMLNQANERGIRVEIVDQTIPLYGMLDVWMALYGTSHPEFDAFYAEHGYAESWARILAAVRQRRAEPQAEPTEAQVEAGCAAFYEGAQGLTSWTRIVAAEPDLANRYRDGIRAALRAAGGVR